MITLSKSNLNSYVGDVLPLTLTGEGIEKTSPITWRVDGKAATIRTFSGDGKFSFNDGILISLVKEGNATVTACFDGKEYSASVTARAMKSVSSEDDLHYYIGDMHCHTTDIHEAARFARHEEDDVSDLVNYVKEKNDIDVTVITDHADVTNDLDFFRGFTLVEDLDTPVILPGAESEIIYTENDRLDILHRHSGELVTLMTAGYINTRTYEEFENEILRSPRPIGIFAHPHVVGYSTNGIWNFDFAKHNTEKMLGIMHGIEMGNGGDNKENLLHEYAYSQALDAGFRVSPTCSSDSHGPIWGYECLIGKTVFMAFEKSREGFHDAFLNNRFYACESGNVKLRYTVNGKTAPADLPIAHKYDFHIELGYFHNDPETRPVICRVMSDYGNVVYETEIDGYTLDFTVNSDSARYFYLKLIDKNGLKTWSTPVWCSREFDKPRALSVTPLDMTDFTASTEKKDASIAINNDPFVSFFSEEKLPTVTIDMKETKDICALGYYPHVVQRRGRPEGWQTRYESKSLVTRFKVHVSFDGENYTEVAYKTCQTLGCETIVTFPEVSARFVKFEVIGNVGLDSLRPNYADTETIIGSLTIFKKN